MAKIDKLLAKNGITPNMLQKLYQCDLLGVLKGVPGIGPLRLEELRNDLKDFHGDCKLPASATWHYRLALDLLKIPMTPEGVCFGLTDESPVIEQLVKLDSTDISRLNDWLNRTVASVEHTIITLAYRDNLTAQEIANKLSMTRSSVGDTKHRAFRKLRTKSSLQELRHIIFCRELIARES